MTRFRKHITTPYIATSKARFEPMNEGAYFTTYFYVNASVVPPLAVGTTNLLKERLLSH